MAQDLIKRNPVNIQAQTEEGIMRFHPSLSTCCHLIADEGRRLPSLCGCALVGFPGLSGWPRTQTHTGDTKWIQEVMKRRGREEWPLDPLISGTVSCELQC